MNRKTILLFFCLLFFGATQSQQIQFENYTTRNGLLSDHIYNMYEDSKGYIWLFSENGTQKYNGREFKTVLKNLSYRDAFMFCFFERKDGRIWVANSRGAIYEVINDSAFLVPGTEKQGEILRKLVAELYMLYVDDSVNIYATSKRITLKYVPKGNQYEPTSLESLAGDTLNYLLLPKENEFLPVTINAEVLEKNIPDTLSIGLMTNPVRVLRFPANFEKFKFGKKIAGNMYLSFMRHIVKWDPTGETIVRRLDHPLLHFTATSNGDIMAACYTGGLLEMDSNLNTLNQYISNALCNDVLADSQNGLWVSTAGHGIYHCRNIEQKVFDPETFNGAVSYVKKVNNTLFAGTMNGAVYTYNNGKFEKHKSGGRSEATDVAFWNNKVYFARKNETSLFSLQDDEVGYSLELVPVSNDTMFSVVRRGVLLYKNGIQNGKPFFYKARFNTGISWPDNQLLLGTDDGPLYFSDTSFHPVQKLAGLNGIPVTRYKRHGGKLWICTAGSGIFYLNDNDSLVRFHFTTSFSNDVVHNINFYDNHALVCTDKGLFKTPMKALKGKSGTERLLTGAVTHAEVHDETVYAATPGGLFTFPWRSELTKPLSATLAEILKNGSQVKLLNEAELTHGDNLEFQFDVISFEAPIALQYRLSGTLSDSGEVSDGYLKFQNIPKGDYTLSVWPSQENATTTAFTFQVSPAWWQSPLFIMAALAGLIFSGFAVGWMISSLNRKRKEARARLEHQIEEYKLVALKAQINPHFLSNCLTAIQQLIYDNKVKEANIYIARFGLLVRKILMYSDKSFIVLEQELEVARLNIELELLRFDNKFTYEVVVDPSITPSQNLVPALLINPVLENAIWHGLLPLGERRAGHLRISCSRLAGSLVIVIEDNGVGRMKYKQAANQTGERQSRGLIILRQRLENINQLYHGANAALTIEDLQSDDSKPAGVRVTISIPLNLEARHHETV